MSTQMTRPGSIYLVTLITVAAIVSMVLIGVRLRLAANSQSAIIEQMSEANAGVLDATEYAIQTISADLQWTTTAQSGEVFDNFTIIDSTYSSSVVDAATGLMPTAGTTTYRVGVAVDHNSVHSAAQLDVLCEKVDYLTILKNLGAVHYWPMNETSTPAEAIDELPEDINGVYRTPRVAGAATNDEGAPVPLFDDDDDHIEVSWSDTFKSNKGAISIWMKNTASDTVLKYYGIFGMQYIVNKPANLSLMIVNGGLVGFISDDGTYDFGKTASSSSKIITRDYWHHVALTWGANGLTIYLDGVQVAVKETNTAGLKTAQAHRGGEQPLKIGAANVNLIFANPETGFKGSLAHASFYIDQLDSTEIAQLAAVKPDFLEKSIVEDSWVRVFE